MVKRGQIAHIDRNNQNSAEDNLAFLCLEHHEEYDSTSRQAKTLQPAEVKHYRDQLHGFWATPESSTHIDITMTAIKDIRLAPHSWKNEFINLYPGGLPAIEQHSTGDVWGTLVVAIDETQFTQEDTVRYKGLLVRLLPAVVEQIHSILLLWGDYLSDDYKHKLQVAIRQINNGPSLYAAVIGFDSKLLPGILKQVISGLQNICIQADEALKECDDTT